MDITFNESSFPNKPTQVAPPVPNPSDQVAVQELILPASSDNEDDGQAPAPNTAPPKPPSPQFSRNYQDPI